MFLAEHKKRFLAALIVIFAIAGVLRLCKLDRIPSGMSWDEAAIGYNGYAIRLIHRDEWLNFMPISFRSFGDYKAPLAIYISGISTWFFGLNLWAVRLPFALFGVLTVIGMAWLTHLLLDTWIAQTIKTKSAQKVSRMVVISVAMILAVSPWHFFFSRASFESGMAMTFIICGVAFCFQSFQSQSMRKMLFACLSAISLVLSLYTYHSAKIVTPLLVITIFVFFFKKVTRDWKLYLPAVIIGSLALMPLVADSVFGNGAQRLSQTSVLSNASLNLGQKISKVTLNYFSHFKPGFLLMGETTTLRHGDGKTGVLLLTEFLLIVGTLAYVRYKTYQKDTSPIIQAVKKPLLFGVVWVLIGFIPAAIGFEIPHANRALLGYGGFLIIQMVGLFILIFEMYTKKSTHQKPDNQTLVLQSILGTGLIVHLLLSLSFYNHYFTRYANDSVEAFSYGYEEAMQEAISLEDDVEKILFTSAYGQPYIYALFFRQTNPIWYQGGSLAKYEFTDKINVGDFSRKNTLIIATPKEIDPTLANKLIIAPNGEVRFVIVRTPE